MRHREKESEEIVQNDSEITRWVQWLSWDLPRKYESVSETKTRHYVSLHLPKPVVSEWVCCNLSKVFRKNPIAVSGPSSYLLLHYYIILASGFHKFEKKIYTKWNMVEKRSGKRYTITEKIHYTLNPVIKMTFTTQDTQRERKTNIFQTHKPLPQGFFYFFSKCFLSFGDRRIKMTWATWLDIWTER